MEDTVWIWIPENSLFRAKSLVSGDIRHGVRTCGRAGWVDWDSRTPCNSVTEEWERWALRQDQGEENIGPIALIVSNLTGNEDGPALKALLDKYEADLEAKLTPAYLGALKEEMLQDLAEIENLERTAILPLRMAQVKKQVQIAIRVLDSKNLPALKEMIGFIQLQEQT